MKKLILIASVAAAAAFAPAQAQSAPDRSVRVNVADLDLATPAGVRALDGRILHAAAALCGPSSAADPHGQRNHDRCIADVRAAAAPARNRAIASRQAERPLLASGR